MGSLRRCDVQPDLVVTPVTAPAVEEGMAGTFWDVGRLERVEHKDDEDERREDTEELD